MSYTLYKRTECNLSIEKETVALRRTGAATEADAIPVDIFEEIEIPEPLKEFEEKFPVHSGRNVGNIGDKTYPTGEGTLEMSFQTAVLLYYILGECATTGTYLHTIAESDDLPTFKVHVEQLNAGAGNDVIKDLIGCIATELKLAVAKDGLVTQSFSFQVPKSIVGTKFTTTTWATFNHADKVMNWEMTELTNFNIDSVDLLTAWGAIPIESLEITMTNNLELLPVLGDPYLDEPKIGTREYELKMTVYPKDDDLYLARNKHPEDYTGAITIKFNRGASDDITLTFSDMYVSDYPNKIPNADDKAVGVEVTFRNSPGGTLGVLANDDKDISYYEVA